MSKAIEEERSKLFEIKQDFDSYNQFAKNDKTTPATNLFQQQSFALQQLHQHLQEKRSNEHNEESSKKFKHIKYLFIVLIIFLLILLLVFIICISVLFSRLKATEKENKVFDRIIQNMQSKISIIESDVKKANNRTQIILSRMPTDSEKQYRIGNKTLSMFTCFRAKNFKPNQLFPMQPCTIYEKEIGKPTSKPESNQNIYRRMQGERGPQGPRGQRGPSGKCQCNEESIMHNIISLLPVNISLSN
ncbi:hypothetical protein SNEBB_003060 [Seison nebaliae]|nr:hypothetical protein SNEBB_003060 [Seison nebaliae]